ncbi:MAG TPA: NrtA/SsuA/CpmA family ABC transporter substrate-binding protein [Candidatus Methanoperedens sp.]
MENKYYGFLVIGLLIAGAAAVTLGWGENPKDPGDNTNNAEPVILRINGGNTTATLGSGVGISTGTLGVAWSKGFLQEELSKVNAKLELVPMVVTGGAGYQEAMSSGSIDIASSGETPMIYSYAAGNPVRIIAAYHKGGSQNAILVRKDSGINSVKDLKSKKAAAAFGGNNHKFLIEVLDNNGLSINKDVEFFNLRDNDAPAALLRGDIDAFSGSYQKAMLLETKENVKIIYDVNQYDNWSGVGIYSVRKPYADKHPEVVKAFLKAVIRTNKWIKEHPEESINYWQSQDNYPRFTYEKLYPDYKSGNFGFEIALSDDLINKLDRSKSFLVNNGLLKKDFDVSGLVEKKYLDEVLAGK